MGGVFRGLTRGLTQVSLGILVISKRLGATNFGVFWITISSPAGRSVFGRRAAFCHHFWSQFWAPFLVLVLGTKLSPDTRIINESFICGPILAYCFIAY